MVLLAFGSDNHVIQLAGESNCTGMSKVVKVAFVQSSFWYLLLWVHVPCIRRTHSVWSFFGSVRLHLFVFSFAKCLLKMSPMILQSEKELGKKWLDSRALEPIFVQVMLSFFRVKHFDFRPVVSYIVWICICCKEIIYTKDEWFCFMD
jgi:hypothetical protein